MIQCIIPAAGISSRFSGLGNLYQKFLLPYKSKPIIIHNLQILSRIHKIDLITIVLNCNDHFSEKFILSNLNQNERTNNIEFKYYDNLLYGNGPLSTILFGIQKNFKSYLVVLSDIILPIEFELSDEETSFISTAFVKDPKRWCITYKKNQKFEFKNKPTQEDIEVLTKDESRSETLDSLNEHQEIDQQWKSKLFTALTGVYYFSDGNTLIQSADAIMKSNLQFGEDENEISKLLEIYQLKNKDIEFKKKTISVQDCGTIDDLIKLSSKVREEGGGGGDNRDFNVIVETHKGTIEKSCRNKKYNAKIIAEIEWYLNKPEYLEKYTPDLLDYDLTIPKYEMNKIHDNKLSEILLYFDRELSLWNSIGELFMNYFCEVEKKSPKFKPRFKKFIKKEITQRYFELDEVSRARIKLKEILKVYNSIRFFKNDEFHHGDLNLSNIFLNHELKTIKFIDPKGGIIGNRIYDLAKITQCLVFGYDFIEKNLYYKNENQIHLYDRGFEEISIQWLQQIVNKYGIRVAIDSIKLTGILFLKMVPLHYENPEHQEIFKNLGIDILSMFGKAKWRKYRNLLQIPSKTEPSDANFGLKISLNYSIFNSIKN